MPIRIHPFRDTDAGPLAEWLDSLSPADDVTTPAGLVHQRRILPRRGRPLWLVAMSDGGPVGFGYEEPQLYEAQQGLRRIWVGVRPDMRQRGIGARLWERLEAHAREVGVSKLKSWAIADPPDGQRFLRKRGFTPGTRELQSWVDPTAVDRTLLEQRRSEAAKRGFRVARLQELLPGLEPKLIKLLQACNQDSIARGETPAPARLRGGFYRHAMLENPTLDTELSTVVLHGETPVALSWLKGDRSRRKYAIEFTATAPEWRGKGLAMFAKLEALDLAARAGVRSVGTLNDSENAAMLAINRRLRSKPLPDLNFYERQLL